MPGLARGRAEVALPNVGGSLSFLKCAPFFRVRSSIISAFDHSFR